ncbi:MULTISPECIES: hypothetical protein [Colwellia]|uniref:Uncharacterized protein n=1 Tax=Colwellia marinimaniae TaxID=1513592 RepID=A0ABQ0MUK1_9GAMM|nr:MULTISPECIES: hypothetical protein [Colwellia]GAW96046.1 hypothetical protein MTCD1_01653 [Colwellia marinimaniae]
MLELLAKLASKLQPFRQLSYLLAAILVGLIFSQLQQSTSQQQPTSPYALLSFFGCIWLLLFNILLSVFVNVPSINTASTGIFSRIKNKVQRSLYHLFALLFIGLTLVIVFLSWRILRV